LGDDLLRVTLPCLCGMQSASLPPVELRSPHLRLHRPLVRPIRDRAGELEATGVDAQTIVGIFKVKRCSLESRKSRRTIPEPVDETELEVSRAATIAVLDSHRQRAKNDGFELSL